MRSYQQRVVESETEGRKWYFPIDDTEDSDFTEPDALEPNRLAELAKRYKVAPELIIEINDGFRGIREAVFEDLNSLLARIENLERVAGPGANVNQATDGYRR